MPQPPGDPRNGHRYRAAVALVLANSDLCHLCGHHDARTVDHIISVEEWWRLHGTYDGVNDLSNLAPAHGMRRAGPNRCATCGRLCNQNRGSRSLAPQPRSRDW
jgi:5-methylcytosine-specific restriction endonuclease McrA